MGERQFGSILTNFLQFWTHTTRLNATKLFREVVLWLGGGTTCFWNERGVDAEFQSWEEGFWEPTGGKRAEHRVLSPEWLYTPIPLNNAPIDFIFGVDKL